MNVSIIVHPKTSAWLLLSKQEFSMKGSHMALRDNILESLQIVQESFR
jgi:hypothetical protein